MGRLSERQPKIGFYVSIVRNEGTPHERRGLLLGPYPTKRAAGRMVWRGRQLAPEADPRAAFDGYGTAKVTDTDPDGKLPQGVLNGRLAAREREEATAPPPEVETYLNRIRNPAKADHAWAVWEALVLGEKLPGRPAGLPVMAAQAVEMRLAEFAGKYDARIQVRAVA